MWQWDGRNRWKIFFLGNCGNGFAKNGRGKKLNGIVAMSLPKMGGKTKLLLSKFGEEFKKKKNCYVHNIFIILLQQITGN